jgi:hypothetical protein
VASLEASIRDKAKQIEELQKFGKHHAQVEAEVLKLRQLLQKHGIKEEGTA